MKKKILVIDDEKDSLHLIDTILTRNGYEVLTTEGEITKKLKGLCADLVILDINLGVKDGDQICRELKDDPETWHIPIILISAMKDLPEIARESGADDFLFKPFNKSDLLRKIEINISLV